MSSVLFALAPIVICGAFFLVITRAQKRKAKRLEESSGIKPVVLKGKVQLTANTSLQFNLALEKHTGWSRFLSRSPTTGDDEFDRDFSITAYRVDVLNVLRQNTSLRQLLLMLKEEFPRLMLVQYRHGKLLLQLSGRYPEEQLAEACTKFHAAIQVLSTAFSSLPPDSPAQRRQQKMDTWARYFPVLLGIMLAFVGAFYNQPLASSEFTWRLDLVGGGVLLLAQAALIFVWTRQGGTRFHALGMALSFSLAGVLFIIPNLVCAVNTWSQQSVITETVGVEQLYKFVPQKGARHYYVLLSSTPLHLATGIEHNLPSLELSYRLFNPLEHSGLQQGSRLEVVEVTGLLGLPYVVKATPL